MSELLQITSKGIYCPVADVYIDPWRAVKTAFVTHAHSDHAYAGHGQYISSIQNIPILKQRLGNHISALGLSYGEIHEIKGVKFSLHSAGHVLGSAQVRVEYQGEVWVAAGDYKRENDGISGAFEVVPCDVFITESTFGLPVFKWRPQEEVFQDINHWWSRHASQGRTCLLGAYSLGKAQRLLAGLDPNIGPIFCHAAIENINEVYEKLGVGLHHRTTIHDQQKKSDYAGAMVICPPASIQSSWASRFPEPVAGSASGWYALRTLRSRFPTAQKFILSDHADWDALIDTVRQTQASKIYVTHGYTQEFSRYLREEGLDARPLSTKYTGDEGEFPN